MADFIVRVVVVLRCFTWCKFPSFRTFNAKFSGILQNKIHIHANTAVE